MNLKLRRVAICTAFIALFVRGSMKVGFLLSGALLIASVCVGQPRSVTGKVTDEFGAPIPGASILVKGKLQGTITDSKGNFSLPVNSGDTVVVTTIGYASHQVVVDERQRVINFVVNGAEESLQGWCCTGHDSPTSPHCGRDKGELKRIFGCTSFVVDH